VRNETKSKIRVTTDFREVLIERLQQNAEIAPPKEKDRIRNDVDAAQALDVGG